MNNQVTVKEWVAMFREIGLNDQAMKQWHQLFEKRYPEAHESFLQWLKLKPEEIKQIRTAHQ